MVGQASPSTLGRPLHVMPAATATATRGAGLFTLMTTSAKLTFGSTTTILAAADPAS